MKLRLQRSTELETATSPNIQLKSYYISDQTDASKNNNSWSVSRNANIVTTSSTVEHPNQQPQKRESQHDVIDGDGGNSDAADRRERGGGGGGGSGGEKYVYCALLGDGMVGKTCLTLSYTQRVFPDRYTATVFDNYPVPVSVEGEEFVIHISDTAGQSDYESLRTSTYESSEVLVLCFSVCDRQSFYSVLSSWLPEIQRHTKGKRPLLLVGTQIDLRKNSSGPSPSATTSSSSSSYSQASSEDIKENSCSSPTDLRPSSGNLERAPSSTSGQNMIRGSVPGNQVTSCSTKSSKDVRSSNKRAFSKDRTSSSRTSSSRTSSKDRTSSRDLKFSRDRKFSGEKTSSRTSLTDTKISTEDPGTFSEMSPGHPKTHRRQKTSSKDGASSTDGRKSSSDHRKLSFPSFTSSSDPREEKGEEEEEEEEEVRWEEGNQLARMIGADCYIECSARSQEGVRQVFQHVVFSALKYRKKKSSLLFRLFSR